jgi:tRNA pseudouridine13 synthase
MYIMKELPEDFFVHELCDLSIEKQGQYAYYLLRKKSRNTVEAIELIARHWRIRPKLINFAGTKDRNAITEQHISIAGGPARDLCLTGIELKYLGRGSDRLNLGSHAGNGFRIVVRNITEKPKPVSSIVNYFDSQRFGAKGNNHLVGKAIVVRDFAKAVELIAEKRLDDYIATHPKDYVGALRILPKKILQIYVHAYQAWLWNRMAESTPDAKELPLIGFETLMDERTEAILKDEGISTRDLIIRQLPELSLAGSSREVRAEVQDLQIGELEPDEFHEGMSKVMISFRLGKGCYATQAIKQMF